MRRRTHLWIALVLSLTLAGAGIDSTLLSRVYWEALPLVEGDRVVR